MKPRLELRNKVRVRTSVKLAVAGAVFATLVAVGFLLYYNFGTSSDTWAVGDSRFSGYNWRKKIVLDQSLLQGSSDLYQFPLLVELKDPDLKHISRGGKMIHLKGSDIRFSKEDGQSLLLSQVERYNPETGELIAWVLLDTLSAKKSNTLYLYFSKADMPGIAGQLLWEEEYQAVWHFNSGLNADHSRRLRATVMGTEQSSGKIGNARTLHANSGDCASFPWLQELDMTGDIHVSAWVKLNETGREQVLVSNQGDRPGGYRLLIDPQGRLSFDFINLAGIRVGLGNATGGVLKTDEWYFVSAQYDLNTKTIQTFVNGIADRTMVVSESPAPSPSALQIGRDLFNEQSHFNGVVDELRISNKIRTSSWIATNFRNQHNPGTSLRAYPAEELQLMASDIRTAKEALGKISDEEREQKDAVNLLHAKKAPDTNNPAPVSESAEAIKARLDNIRRVSGENKKSN